MTPKPTSLPPATIASKRPKLRTNIKAGSKVGFTFFDASHGGTGSGG